MNLYLLFPWVYLLPYVEIAPIFNKKFLETKHGGTDDLCSEGIILMWGNKFRLNMPKTSKYQMLHMYYSCTSVVKREN
jgi:hypothetical protein